MSSSGPDSRQLTIAGLLKELGPIPPVMPVLMSGFGLARNPASLRRHRDHADGLAIEATYSPAGREVITAEMLRVMLLSRLGQPASAGNPHPDTPDTPVWAVSSQELSFNEVTGVDLVQEHAVIRSINAAPDFGPSIQRIPDDEVLRRNHECTGPHAAPRDTDPYSKVNKWLLKAIPKERARTRIRLEEARRDLERLDQEIRRMEDEMGRSDYILGLTDAPPGAAGTTLP